jgi:hypothetical protein
MAVSDIRSAAPMARPMPQRPDHPRPVEARRAEPPRAAPQRVEHRQEAVRVQDRPAPASQAKGRHVDIRA